MMEIKKGTTLFGYYQLRFGYASGIQNFLNKLQVGATEVVLDP